MPRARQLTEEFIWGLWDQRASIREGEAEASGGRHGLGAEAECLHLAQRVPWKWRMAPSDTLPPAIPHLLSLLKQGY